MLCSPPPATTLASSCAGSEGFCAPCCRRSSQRSRIHNRPKTGRTLLLHERLLSLLPFLLAYGKIRQRCPGTGVDEPDDVRLVQLVRQLPPKSRVVSQRLPPIDARSA